MAYGAGLPGFGAGRGAGFGAGAGGRYGAGTGVGYGAGLAGAWLPTDLGASLAAWYSADAGCYTDAACLFASASSQYLSRASEAALQTGDIDFTVVFWVKMDISLGYTSFVNKGRSTDAGGEFGVFKSTGSGSLYYGVRNAANSATTEVFATSAAIPNNAWAMVEFWHDSVNDVIGIRVNNGTGETTAHSGGVFAGVNAFTVGKAVTGTVDLDGSIGRVGFWKRLLTAGERTSLYNAGAGKFYADLTTAEKVSLVEYWNLCESSSTRVGSHAGLNLTPTNGPTVAAGPGEGLCVNNSPCKRVTDYSGNSRNLLQATVSAQPIWLASGQNGLPVLRFTSANSTTIKATYTLAQPADVFAAFAWTAQDYALDGGSLHAMALLTNGANAQMYAGSFGPALTSPSTAFHTFRMLFSGASSVFSIDSGADATGNPGTATTAGLTVGSSGTPGNYSSLDFGELFIASAAVAAATTPKTYLKSRWATP